MYSLSNNESQKLKTGSKLNVKIQVNWRTSLTNFLDKYYSFIFKDILV